MIRAEKPSKANSVLALSLLTLACLAIATFTAGGAKAFTHTIADIDDPTVGVKVLGLEVEAARTLHHQDMYPPAGGMVLSDTYWDHTLEGQTDGSLTAEQFPKLTIRRNHPTTVSIAGKVVTERAEGEVEYSDMEFCSGGRTTTKSPLLDVSITGIYQPGTPSSSARPEMSLKTENLDPWVYMNCFHEGDLPPEATHIQTFDSQTPTVLTYSGMGASSVSQDWVPVSGGLTTTDNGCTAEFCDFTIAGQNTNDAWMAYGTATSKFTLRLRLEYPKPPEEPTTAPDTMITKGPKRLIKTRSGKAKVAIRFSSTGPEGTKFRCRLDKGAFSPCTSPFKRKVGPGKHRFAVVSVDQGEADKSPAVHKWRVSRR